MYLKKYNSIEYYNPVVLTTKCIFLSALGASFFLQVIIFLKYGFCNLLEEYLTLMCTTILYTDCPIFFLSLLPLHSSLSVINKNIKVLAKWN